MEREIVSTVPMAESHHDAHSVRGTTARTMYTATVEARAWVQDQAWFVDVKKVIAESLANVHRTWSAWRDFMVRCVKRAREWKTTMD